MSVRVVTSDNDPPDGFRLGPKGTLFVSKELNTPSNLSVHAVVPGNEKTLEINGEPTAVIKPNEATGDPLLMRITGKQGEHNENKSCV